MSLPQSLIDNPRLGAWLSFAETSRVHLATGKVELGQGILTALVQLAAEELDVAPDRVTIVSGQTDSTPDERMTTGSQSVEVAGRSIQLAAAQARAALLAVAAAHLDTAAESLTIRDGAVLKNGAATNIDYWALADGVDWDQPVTGAARLKPASERTLVGRSLPRIDLPVKVRGAGFIHDIVLPGMQHARMLRRPAVGAQIIGLDEARLLARCPTAGWVRSGDAVAVVAPSEADAVLAREVAESCITWSTPVREPVPRDLGLWLRGQRADTTTALAQGTAAASVTTLEALFSRPFLAHASIAPSCGLALWDGTHLTVWSHSQGVFILRNEIARVLDLDPATVTVHHRQSAGCYGHNGADDAAFEAALIATLRPGTPIRVLWTRADELREAPCGASMAVQVRAGLDAEGRIAHWQQDIWSTPHSRRPGSGGRPGFLTAELLPTPWERIDPPDPPLAAGGGATRNALPLYDIPGTRVVLHALKDVPVRSSALRGLGAHLNVVAIESVIDDLAAAAGRDPVAFRLAHMPDTRARGVLERAYAMAGGTLDTGRDDRSRGIAWARYKNRAAYCATVVEITIGDAVTVGTVWCALDAGTVVNPDGARNQTEGGIIQSISWTLKEALAFDTGGVTTADWDSYPILRFSEVPAMHIDVLDKPDEPSLGVGEAAAGPTAAAIVNAVARGLGTRIGALPLTAERLAEALLGA